MRIIEFIQELGSGGAERFVVDFCNYLSKDNEIYLVTQCKLEGHYAFYLHEVQARVKVIDLKCDVGDKIQTLLKLNRIFKKLKPDIIHTHTEAFNYVALIRLLSGKKIKYVHTVHSTAIEEAGGRFKTVLRKLCFSRNLIIPVTISKASLESFTQYYGTDAIMIPNGRNIPQKINISKATKKEIELLKRTPNSLILICLARFNEVKRQPLIAKVAKILEQEGFDFEIIMVGSLNDIEIVEKTKAVGCDRIHILGERHNVMDYLALSDAFVLMSSFEGLPISLIEAMGVGTIPICTPVGGIVDLIKDGINGFIGMDISEESCIEVLRRFLKTNENERKCIRQNAKDSYKPYSMDECANNYISLFNKLLKQ